MAKKRPVQFPARPIGIYDLEFRPASYRDVADPVAAITQNIKGQLRRDLVRDFLKGKLSADHPPFIEEWLEDEVSDDMRRFLGSRHPAWFGGEFLPGYERGEVEIARIVLRYSVPHVLSIRARRTRAGTMMVRMMDQYGAVFRSVHSRAKRPLTMGQLVEFIDNATMAGAQAPTQPYLESRIEQGAKGDINFVLLESCVYPMLAFYYATRLVAWEDGKRRDATRR